MNLTARPSDPRVTVVVPARNEARNLEVVLPRLPLVHEVIVVDGASTDDTAEVVARVAPHAKLLHQTRRGKGNALAVGFAAATGDVVVMFDADGSANPEEIATYVRALVGGADFAKGSRVLGEGGSEDITAVRDAGNRGLTLFTNLVIGTRYTDLCYGYNAFWRDVLPSLALPSPEGHEPQRGDGFEIETMINVRVAQAGLAVTEVPSVELVRIFGESNLHAVRDGLRVLRTILTERLRPVARRRTAPASVAVPDAAAMADLPAMSQDHVIDLRAHDAHGTSVGRRTRTRGRSGTQVRQVERAGQR